MPIVELLERVARDAASGRRIVSVAALVVSLLPINTARADAVTLEPMLEAAGCIGCHRIESRLVGPAMQDVAARYRNEVQADIAAALFEKIRNGGEGNWGDMPMPAKSDDNLPDDELRALIAEILRLR